jgi:hypothetical protein
MSDPATLASMLRSTGPLFLRFLDGFDDDNRTRQAPGLPNHASWSIGHLAITMHFAADYAVGFNAPQKLPTSDWIHGDGTAGDPSRYDTESVRFGSTPTKDAARYPRFARAVEIFDVALDRLASETAALSAKGMEREVKWGSGVMTVEALIHRIGFHNGMHAGQITDLRRALGMPGVIG